MKLSNTEIFLIKLSLVSRFISFISCAFLNYAFEDYDMSSNLLISKEDLDQNSFSFGLFNTFLRWDSLYFSEIYQNGYLYDKNHVFFPLYPLLLSGIKHIFSSLMHSNEIINLVIIGIVANVLLNCCTCLLFYRLSNYILKESRLGFLSAIIFLFNPASVFYSAIYTESLFAFVTIFATHIFYKKKMLLSENYKNFFSVMFFPIVLLMIAVLIRSNGLFYVTIPGYFILKEFFLLLRQNKIFQSLIMVFIGLMTLILMLIPYWFVVSVYPTQIYCNGLENDQNPVWCIGKFPNLYDFNQKEHWNVSFLGQYKLSRIFFIYWGMHSLLIMGWLIYDFLKQKWKSFVTLGFLGENRKNFYSEEWNPFMIYTVVLFVISVFWAHTQSCTRFFSSNPCFIWFLSYKIFGSKLEIGNKGENKINRLLFMYIVYFNVAGNFMFSNYLPWT